MQSKMIYNSKNIQNMCSIGQVNWVDTTNKCKLLKRFPIVGEFMSDCFCQ